MLFALLRCVISELKKDEKGREKEKEREIEVEKDNKKEKEKEKEAVKVTDLEKEREKIREKEREREKEERDSLVGRSRAESNLNAFDLKQERARRQQLNEEDDLRAFNIKRLELEKVLCCSVCLLCVLCVLCACCTVCVVLCVYYVRYCTSRWPVIKI